MSSLADIARGCERETYSEDNSFAPCRNLAAAGINRALTDIGCHVEGFSCGQVMKRDERTAKRFLFNNKREKLSIFWWASFLTDDVDSFVMRIRIKAFPYCKRIKYGPSKTKRKSNRQLH